MTAPPAASANFASDEAHVGVQAGVINGDVTYQVSSDDSPAKKFRTGVRYLEGGMPTLARQFIGEAIAMDYKTTEVYFFQLLSLLSGRTLRQFSPEDSIALTAARRRPRPSKGDRWADGTNIVFRLLQSQNASLADSTVIIKEFDQLDQVPRDLILRHLDLLLEGSLEEQLWRREVARVRAEQMGRDRKDRIWKFFQPKPARPRVREPKPVMTTRSDWFINITASVLPLAGATYVGRVLVGHDGVLALLAYLISVSAGGSMGALSGLEWYFQTRRLQAANQRLRPSRRPSKPPPGGFASEVDKLFDRYFAKYKPDGVDRQVWLAGTTGIRMHLRDEVVDLYRESRVSARRVAWLIRHQVGQVKKDWGPGGLTVHHERFLVRAATKATFAGGLAALLAGVFGALSAAIQAEPLSTSIIALATVVSGWWVASRWLYLMLERKRFGAEQEESRQRMAESQAAFDRWQAKLADKPDDPEMAAWLDCDRKVLMDDAMRHYKLVHSDVIANTFIEAPATVHERARVLHGPWRYTRYQLLVFLLTADGVRQVTVDLDFQQGSFHDWKRRNYRFDAVASVDVHVQDDHQQTFDLVLVNGPPISLQVTEPSSGQLEQGEDSESLSTAALDASGLTNALYVLESVAADGKNWIGRITQRGAA